MIEDVDDGDDEERVKGSRPRATPGRLGLVGAPFHPTDYALEGSYFRPYLSAISRQMAYATPSNRPFAPNRRSVQPAFRKVEEYRPPRPNLCFVS
uniref:Uncharacterized protein n=1 Tax=Plectus sambesii TaxID=2011161 RepID=A0A914WKE9_9BILA